jgi:hypothetical protein
MARRIAGALRPDGIFVCQFRYEPFRRRKKGDAGRKAVAWLTFGNFWYQSGDTILGDREFIHPFTSDNEVIAEVIPAGFMAIHSQLLPRLNCGAILFKKTREPLTPVDRHILTKL